jgi:hypothetical protein
MSEARITVTARYLGIPGRGNLVISEGRVGFRFSESSRRMFSFPEDEIVATRPLVIVRARLLPPFFDAGLVLRADEVSLRLLLWWVGSTIRVGSDDQCGP